jgi:hypothetical protein
VGGRVQCAVLQGSTRKVCGGLLTQQIHVDIRHQPVYSMYSVGVGTSKNGWCEGCE